MYSLHSKLLSKNVKPLITWNERFFNQYLILISPNILARARAWVDTVLFGNYAHSSVARMCSCTMSSSTFVNRALTRL